MALVFRRGWWKPWNWSTRRWLLTILVSVVASPIVLRWICLWSVPDVALPFDVEDAIAADIPKSEDPSVGYASAWQKIRSSQTQWSIKAVNDAVDSLDPKWDSKLDQWLIDNRDGLDEFRRTSEMEHRCRISLRGISNYSMGTPLPELRELIKISEAEAARNEKVGDFEAAWVWHRATFRSAQHVEIYRFTWARIIAYVIRHNSLRGISHWAAQPSLTADRLRSARTELAIEVTKRIPLSEVAKANYVCARNTLGLFEYPNLLFPDWDSTGPLEPQLLVVKHFALWAIGQPELTLRLNRQLLVNTVGQIDQPLHLRAKALKSKRAVVFERDPLARRLWGQLDPAQLNSKLDNSLCMYLFTQSLLLDMDYVGYHSRRDDSRAAAIGVLLAAHEYQRIHGDFPATIEQLVPGFLDAVPFDPMDATGAPLRYRRDDHGEAIVWSLGRDGIDDGGDIRGESPKDLGYRIYLKDNAVSRPHERPE